MIGAIPVFGDVFSIWFRSNVKNVQLLERYADATHRESTAGDWLFVIILIAALHDQLAVESIDALKTACQEGLVRSVKGFGVKSEAKLLADIDKLVQPSERVLLHHVLDAAKLLLAHLRAAPALVAAASAGALRRRQETVRQLIIVAGTEQPKAIIDHFLCFPSIVNTIELTEHECLVQLAAGMKARLVIAEPQDYAATLHRWTGSKAHLERLAQLAPSPAIYAQDAGNENGIPPSGELIGVHAPA